MGNTDARRGRMEATLHHTAGVYRAEYRGELNPENADAREFPDSHIGTSAQEVRMFVEQMAANLGYEGVNWHNADET